MTPVSSLRTGSARCRGPKRGRREGSLNDTFDRDRITVVVLTFNRRAGVLHTVSKLMSVPEQPQIIVVDNGSSDGTVAALRTDFPSVRCIATNENLGSAGRNIGVRAAPSPYVAFSDDDSWWAPGSLGRAAGILDANPDVAVVAARVLVGPAERFDDACLPMAESPLKSRPDYPGKRVLGFLACAVMVRRSAFLEAGGFTRKLFIGGEEELLAMDLAASGGSIAYCDSVVVHHHPTPGPERAQRLTVLARNRIWTAWLRRPLRHAVRETLQLMRTSFREPAARRAVVQVLIGLPWALRNRRRLPANVEADLNLVAGASAAKRGALPR